MSQQLVLFEDVFYAEYYVGARINRFGCRVTRVERVQRVNGRFGDDPKWWKGPAKVKGQSAISCGNDAIFIAVDVHDPSPDLDAATRAAYESWLANEVE